MHELEARRRVLAWWSRGSRLLRFTGGPLQGYLLIWPESRSLRVERIPAEALLELESRLVGQGLSADAFRVFAPGSLLLRRSGVWTSRPLDEGQPVEAGDWLDLGGFTRCRAWALAAPPSPPSPALPPPPGDTRVALGIAGASGEAEIFLGKLRQATSKPTGGGSGLWGWLTQWTSGNGGPTSAPRRQQPVKRKSAILAKLALSLGVWQVAGFRQMRYLRQLYSSLEAGDIERVLRQALPLGSGDNESASPSFGVPGQRKELSISAKGGGGLFMPMSEALFADLGTRYQRLAEELERRGDFDKAAFVWAELLNQPRRAVILLEKQQRFRQAAEIAEIRALSPALVARLWILAGELERALILAASHGVFAGMVKILESEPAHLHAARLLRQAWAERLVEGGDFAAATRTLWPIESRRQEVLPWIEEGLRSAEGSSRGELLLFLQQLAPERSVEVMADWRRLLAAGDEDFFERRQSLAELLVAAPKDFVVAPLSRLTVRALLQDGDNADTRRLRLALLERAADPALSEDLQTLQVPKRLDPVSNPMFRYSPPAAVGGLAISDLVVLPGRKLLLGAGEMGSFLLSWEGQVLHHFELPADELKVADHGRLAIAVGRGEREKPGQTDYVFVSRLDLARKRAAHWTEGRFEAMAADFDGQSWVVARDGALELLDPIAKGCRILWRLPRLDGPVYRIARGPKGICFVVASSPPRLWRLDADLILRDKDDLPLTQHLPTGNAEGLAACIEKASSILLVKGEVVTGRIVEEDGVRQIELYGDQLLLMMGKPGSQSCRVHPVGSAKPQVKSTWIGLPAARIFGKILAGWDHQGRWVLVDLHLNRVIAEGRFFG